MKISSASSYALDRRSFCYTIKVDKAGGGGCFQKDRGNLVIERGMQALNCVCRDCFSY